MAREHYWPTGSKTAQDQEKRALAVEHDRQVRNRSVANDIRLDLPVSVARPDGEEYPARARLRSHDKRYEIQKPYIQGPPNKTVCDSIDCLDRTVTQPSSSRSGGSKSTSKSSSSHWGLSWSRSNKSPPSQCRSRGQQRHPHPSNPSTSVRNASSSSCETARGSGGTHQGLLAGPSLFSSLSTSSSSSLGSTPNSSLLGFHRAATSLVAGDTVHSAFPSHHHHHHPLNPSHQSQPPLPTTSTIKQIEQHQPLVFPGGSGGPSIAEKLSEKVQHCTNVIVGSTRTSPNNNSSSTSTSTSVLSRLIDPDSKLFRSSSKDSKRSSNGKNGKSHRTDQSSSASSSSSSSLVTLVECASSGHDDQHFITNHPNHGQSHPVPFQLPMAVNNVAAGLSPMQSCNVPSPGQFFTSFHDRGEGSLLLKNHMPTSLPPDNNNCCSSSGGRSTSQSGPSSSSGGIDVRMDAYDAGANTIESDTNKGLGGYAESQRWMTEAPATMISRTSSPRKCKENHGGDGVGQSTSHPSAVSDCENGNGRVPRVATTVQSQGGVNDNSTNTLKLSHYSSPSASRGGDHLLLRDEEMKMLPMMGYLQQQQMLQACHQHEMNPVAGGGPCPELHSTEMMSPSADIPFTSPSSGQQQSTSLSSVGAVAALPRHVPPSATTTANVVAAATAVVPSATCSSADLYCCSVKEKKRGDDNTFSSSGCSTDPNYSTFAKVNNNSNSCIASSVQSQYLDSSNNTCNSMDTSSNNNENNNFAPSQLDTAMMISESTSSTTNHNNANNSYNIAAAEMITSPSPTTTSILANELSDDTYNKNSNSSMAVVSTFATPTSDDVFDDDENITSTVNSSSNTASTTMITTSVRETAHHCELSETFIASKNDTDQYCTAAAAELITSLHSSSNSSPSSSTSSSASALSIQQTSSPISSSSMPTIGHAGSEHNTHNFNP